MEKPEGVSFVLFLTVLLSVCLVPTDLNVIVSAEEPMSSFEPTQLELWDTQPIDQWGSEGSIAFDSNNNPHVCYFVNSYFQKTNRSGLHYGVWKGTNWNTQTLDPKGNGRSIVIDNNDNPHILYFTNPGILKHVFWNGSNWTFNVVDDSEWCGRNYDMTMDSKGNPHIVYFNRKTLEMKYGFWNGSAWVKKVVGEPLTGYSHVAPSIVLDSKNHPRIIYNEPWRYEIEDPETSEKKILSTSEIKYAAWNGTNWIVQTVGHNVSTTVGSLGNLVLDSNENPHLSYVNRASVYNPETGISYGKTDLNYAQWDGSNWHVYSLDSKPVTENKKSYIVMDNDDKPYIYCFTKEYIDDFPYAKYGLIKAQWTGSDWKIETVDSNLTYVETIVMDKQGELHLLFDEPLGTYHGAWLEGKLTHATLIEKPKTESTTIWIAITIATATIFCIGLGIYYTKRK